MRKEKKEYLTAVDLALVLGCEVEIIAVSEIFRGNCPQSGARETNNPDLLDFVKRGLYTVKPLLRPLPDMTCYESEIWFDAGNKLDIIQAESARTAYLLRQGFDLFGWIDVELAIDKTKA